MASRVVPFPVPAPAQASLSLSPDPDDDTTDAGEERRGVKSTSGTLEEGNAHAFPRRGVRLAWLRRFVDACKQKKYTWTAKDFLKAEHGGGADDVLQVITTDNLQEHRTRMNAAGKDGDGKPTTVQYFDIPFELMTTNDVCFGIVKPATEQVKTSYAEMLSNTEPREVNEATVFVSHAWKYVFVSVVDALSSLSENAYVWFDVFTVNQHASLQVPPDWWFTTFKEAVASIGHTVLILMPWDDPIPLTRAWCIWEILSTIDDGKAKLEICLPEVEQKAFADFLVKKGADKVTVKMIGMDVQRAEAWKKDDRDAILNAVKVYPGGASEVNKRIKDQMRSWLIKSAISALDTLDVEKRATSELLMDVASLLSDQGKYAKAEPLYREALDGCRRVLGDAHPQTLASISGLAILLSDQGKYAKAEPLYREALDGCRRELGDTHPRTLGSINNLAGLLSDQRKYADAEPLLREALDGYRRELGDAHPDTLMSINNLAMLLSAQGKYADAEPLLREALDGRRRELGDAHRDTLMSINNLAVLLMNQRKYADAEPLYREALDGSRRELGDAHPDTLMSINNLAILISKQGKYDDAEPLYREALDGHRHELGDTHPDTLASINNLALLLSKQGKYADAEPLYREALDGFRRELGDAHPDTLGSINNLAILLLMQGKNADAELMYREALDGKRRELGDTHPHYAAACMNYAKLLLRRSYFVNLLKVYRAWPYFYRAARAYTATYGLWSITTFRAWSMVILIPLLYVYIAGFLLYVIIAVS
ncbi:EF-hand domain-containing protein [Pseudoscourfieldia marina]